MKRLLQLIAGLVLLAAAPSRAAIAFVSASSSSQCFNGLGVTSHAFTLPAATTAGNDVVIGILTASTRTVSSITDGGSTYSFKTATATSGTSEELWEARSVVAATTITVTMSGSQSGLCIAVMEYSGVAALGTTSSSASLLVSLTTQDANNFVAAAHFADSVTSAAVGTFLSSTGNLRSSATSTLNIGIAGCDNTAASATSVTCEVTNTGSLDASTSLALELRSTTGSSAGPPTPTVKSYFIKH